ncbi:Asp23/Gls24 family envelope stress response protein [Streptomyces sp. NPDC050560]|uniref:Asp23/Gls24 family envelope stress response protein n=1 Tax=Streptomyces sp. NPDC050560 TaxID=3365630 RepID=UPI0037B60A4B
MTDHTDLPGEPPAAGTAPAPAPVGRPPTPAPDDDERLACGRLLSTAWDIWEGGDRDEHSLSCPHCARAVDELRRLETAVDGLRAATADTSGYDASDLTRRVMDVVRMELRPGRPLPLGGPAEDLWVVEAAAARTLRAAAETVRGVRAGSCRLEPPGEQAEDGVGVRLEVQVPGDVPLPETAERVRNQVAWAAHDRLGLRTGYVDIRITDLVARDGDHHEGSGA